MLATTMGATIMPPAERRNSKLTDDDIKALADRLAEQLADDLVSRIEHRFYSNIGQGVWDVVKKCIIGALIFIAAYGSFKR